MILAMVRHGLTNYNQNGLVQGRINIPLNKTGKMQSEILGEKLRLNSESFDVIASSSLSRALETAFIIRKKLKMNGHIHVLNQFVERDFYHLDGTPVESAMPLVRIKNYKHEKYEYDDKMVERISHAALNLYERFKDQKVLLVAHSHVIKALLVYVDPIKYSFADLINHLDIIYFEINDKKEITVIKK
jgi:broad specificity phosphatase PhoE